MVEMEVEIFKNDSLSSVDRNTRGAPINLGGVWAPKS